MCDVSLSTIGLKLIIMEHTLQQDYQNLRKYAARERDAREQRLECQKRIQNTEIEIQRIKGQI